MHGSKFLFLLGKANRIGMRSANIHRMHKPDLIRKKYKLKDGDDFYLLAARHLGKPKFILSRRIR